ncbi:MAG: recombinase family protein [Bacteroidia bacterium]
MKQMNNKDVDFLKSLNPKIIQKSIYNLSDDCWAYIRVSTPRQMETNNSIDTQEKTVRKYAISVNCVLLEDRIYGRCNESAKTDEFRKEFMRMLSDLKSSKRKPKYLIMYVMSRFSRSKNAIEYFNKIIDVYGVHIIEAVSEISSETPQGRVALMNKLVDAHKENVEKMMETAPRMKQAQLKGIKIGKAPIGYDHYGHRVKNPAFYSPTQKIVINADGRILQKAWHWKLEGMSDTKILKKLKNLGFELLHQRLSKIWRNPFYCGYPRSKALSEEPIPTKYPYEPLVSVAVFKKVYEIVTNNPSGFRHRIEYSTTPLKDLLICSSFGRKYTSYEVKKKKVHYYKCRVCNGTNCNAVTTPHSKNKGVYLTKSGLRKIMLERVEIFLS